MSELVVLFEDNAHESLLRQVLSRVYKLRPPRVRYLRCTDCTGVERALLGEVRRLREKKHQRSRGLLVVIDADKSDGDWRRLERDLGAAARELARVWEEALDSELPSIADARRELARVTAPP